MLTSVCGGEEKEGCQKQSEGVSPSVPGERWNLETRTAARSETPGPGQERRAGTAPSPGQPLGAGPGGEDGGRAAAGTEATLRADARGPGSLCR